MRLIQQDPSIKLLIQGLVNRQIASVLHDPYANAYNQNEEGGEWQNDIRTPPMTPHVFEGKYELDSLAAILKLSRQYYQHSNNDHSMYDKNLLFLFFSGGSCHSSLKPQFNFFFFFFFFFFFPPQLQ